MSPGQYNTIMIQSVCLYPQLDSLADCVEPVDYEDFLDQHQLEADRDPLHRILHFPPDDIVVTLIPRHIRTLQAIVPEEG